MACAAACLVGSGAASAAETQRLEGAVAAPRAGTFAPPLPPGAGLEAAARAFFERRSGVPGGRPPESGLELMRARARGDRTYLRFQQTLRGLPVFAAEIVFGMDAEGGVRSVLSDLARQADVEATGGLDLAPGVSPGEVVAAVKEAAGALHGARDAVVTEPRLTLFVPAVIGETGPPRLVWDLVVSSGSAIAANEQLLVDANTGQVVERFARHHAALDRTIHDAENRAIYDAEGYVPFPGVLARSEGEAATRSRDVDDVYDFMGDTYFFYLTRHGLDSLDGLGMPLRATVRLCIDGQCPWPSAMWAGTRAVFGAGWVADDFVAHELTHGVTQHASGLLYRNASGAINEAFSDIWGEFVDLTNARGDDGPGVRWEVAEDAPGGPIRSMSDPTRAPFHQPDRLGSPYYRPPVGDPNPGNDYGGVHTNSGIVNKLCYLLTDGDTFNGRTVQGMGIAKVADLFYLVNAMLLPQGADWSDLADALKQAAVDLGWDPGARGNLLAALRAVELVPPLPPRVSLVGGSTITGDVAWSADTVYVVQGGDLSVAAGGRLTIPAGTVVKFDQGRSLKVLPGAGLRSVGTAVAPVVFTSLKDDRYGGDSNEDGTESAPAAGGWGGVHLMTDSAEVSHCRFRFGGADAGGAPGQLRLEMPAGGQVAVTDCAFDSTAAAGPALHYDAGTAPVETWPGIQRNRFDGCPSGIRASGSALHSHFVIRDNELLGVSGVGIAASQVSGLGGIAGNTVVGTRHGGTGIALSGVGEGLRVQGNTCVWLGRGVEVDDGRPILGSNDLFDNEPYDLYGAPGGAGDVPIEATHVWWGTVDTSVIRARIHDRDDDPASPRFEVLPLAAERNVALPLSVSPPAIDAVLYPGMVGRRTLTARNGGSGPVAFRVSVEPAAAWLALDPPDGILEPGAEVGLDLVLDARGGVEGTFLAFVTLTDRDRPWESTEARVTMVVSAEAGATPVPSRGVEAGEGAPAVGIPGDAGLVLSALPNPSGASVRLSVAGAGAGARLRIYDAAGRRVRDLGGVAADAPRWEVVWDGTGDDGRPVPSGIYLARLEGRGSAASRRLVLMR